MTGGLQRTLRRRGNAIAAASAQRVRREKAIVVFSGMSLSMLLGIGFQSFLASRLGTNATADAYYLGATVPTLVATALLGSAPSALIRYAVDVPTALRLERRSLPSRLVLYSCAVSALTASLALMLRLGAPVFPGELRSQIATFLFVTTPVPPLALLGAMGAVRALARNQFVIATFGGAVNGLGLLAAAVALSTLGLGAAALGLAVDAGYVLQVALVWRALRATADPTRASHDRLPAAMKAAIAGFLFLAGASAIYKSQPLVERLVGAFVGHGIPAALGYEDKITSGLSQLAVFGFALTALPMLSRDLSEREAARAADRLRRTLTGTFASTIAVLAFGLASAGDLVHVFYERGAFGAHAAAVTRSLVLFALPSIAFSALAGPLVSLEYAAGRVREVATVGVIGFALGATATAVLAGTIGYRGIVLGTGAGFAFTFALFARRTSRVLPEWSWRSFVRIDGGAIGIAAVAAIAVCIVASRLVPAHLGSSLLDVVVLGARLALSLGVSFGVVLAVRHAVPGRHPLPGRAGV
jgi:putative peptidoglycan lipid II flippase